MPGSPGQPPYEEHLTWTTISDFSQGVIENSNFANGVGSNGPVPALQLGSAQFAKNCIALPNGGLGPLPGVDVQVTPSLTPDEAYITGTIAYGPVGLNLETYSGADELLISYESLPFDEGTPFTLNDPVVGVLDGPGLLGSGGTIGNRAWSLIGWQELTGDDFTIASAEGPSSIAGIQACSMAMTELNYSDPTMNGYPKVVFSHLTMLAGADPFTLDDPTLGELDGIGVLGGGPGGDSSLIAFYPNWPDPATGGFTQFTDSPSVPCWVIAHQNRVVLLNQFNVPWTTTASSPEFFYSAEFFNYTEPPNSATLGGQHENFVQENPTAHGAWGSISASELFLVRHNGGGYVISGDLNVPTVTRLPGVTSTNGSCQVAAQTPIGLIYGSANNGVWIWNGGNNSVKISNQLNDDFFMLTYDLNDHPVSATGPLFNFNNVGDLIYCPNNWVYSMTLNSWWSWEPVIPIDTNPFTLNDPVLGVLDENVLGGDTVIAAPMAWFWPTFDGEGMWAFPQTISATNDPSAYRVSRLTPCTTYEWNSYPMPFTKNRIVSIRQVAVRAQGLGSITINFNNPDGGNSAGTSPSPFLIESPGTPQLIQGAAAALGPDIVMQVTAEGVAGGSAPMIYDISVGWEVAQEVNPL